MKGREVYKKLLHSMRYYASSITTSKEISVVGLAISDGLPFQLQLSVLAYDAFVRNDESVMATQHIFRCHFNIGENGAFSSCNTIRRYVEAFRSMGNMKKNQPGYTRTTTTSENIHTMREAITRSPRRFHVNMIVYYK